MIIDVNVFENNTTIETSVSVSEMVNNVEIKDLQEVSKPGKVYSGEYTVIPKTTAQTLETAQRFLDKNVEIKEIPYAETSNSAGGETVYIAKEIE